MITLIRLKLKNLKSLEKSLEKYKIIIINNFKNYKMITKLKKNFKKQNIKIFIKSLKQLGSLNLMLINQIMLIIIVLLNLITTNMNSLR